MKIQEYEINEFLSHGGFEQLVAKLAKLNIDLTKSFGLAQYIENYDELPDSLCLELYISQLQTKESRGLQEFEFSVPFDAEQLAFDSLIKGFLALKGAFSFRHEWSLRAEGYYVIAVSSSTYSDESASSSVRELERIKKTIMNLSIK